MAIRSRFDTHEVFNQSPPYENVDLFLSDVPLQEAVKANGAPATCRLLSAFGKHWGTAEMFALGRQANENPPKLHTFDAKGFRRDTVEFHPAYHQFMRESVAAGLHASTWTERRPARRAAGGSRARGALLHGGAGRDRASVSDHDDARGAGARSPPSPRLRRRSRRRSSTRNYDPAFRPWREKSGMTLGMGMTEKQGGTDVRANTTTATPDGDAYSIVGHKWFLSAPMSDAFLVLAQAPGGLTCFLMPRFRARRLGQRAALSAAQGQARQPLQCVERSRIHRTLSPGASARRAPASAPFCRWCN